MEQRQLGKGGPWVSAIGFGCMSIGIADVYTSSTQDDTAAIELIHRALDLVSTFSTRRIFMETRNSKSAKP